VLSERIELRVEVLQGESPIRGHLTDDHGQRIAFAGWAELVSLIERASSGWAGPPATDDASTPPDQLKRRNP
jgi:hypothetical protein